MTSIYNTGTVSVTNGNAVVTGTGTAWAVSLVTGGLFIRLGLSVPILSVDSDTQITLASTWPGATATGATYAIDRENSDAANIVDLYDKLTGVLITLSLAGIHPNNSGSLAKRNALTLTADDDNYLFLHAEIGVAFAFYRWDGPSLAWVGPFPVADAAAGGPVSSLVAGTGVAIDSTNPAVPVVSAARPGTAKTTPVDADEVSLFDSAALFVLKRLSWTNLKATLKTYFDTLYTSTALARREFITVNRTYYVGYNMGAATVSIASPGVVTKAGHGLVAGSRASFSILPNTKTAAVSVASPAVVSMANTFVAGQPIVFSTTGRLPKGLVAGTTYFVIATGLSGSGFQIAATVGGAAINTSNPTFTVTIASPGVVTETAHGRSTGDAIQLATTGALPTGLAAATTYYLNVIDANTYNLRLTPDGANINTTGTQSGTHSVVQFGTHYLSETGTLPTGITAGQDYFVIATGLTTNTFQFSATLGGAAINTTGSTAGTIVLKTGSDSNAGLALGASTSFLTVQQALNVVAALDLSIYNVTIQVADGVYNAACVVSAPWVGSGVVTITGNVTIPANSLLQTLTSQNGVIQCSGNGKISVNNIKVAAPNAVGIGMHAFTGGVITWSNVEFGPCANYQIYAENGSKIAGGGGAVISGGAQYHVLCAGYVNIVGSTISLTGVPAFSVAFVSISRGGGLIEYYGMTFSGSATGKRYNNGAFGTIFSNGGGASYYPGNAAGTDNALGLYS